jgi:hypothetical protein
MKRCLRRSRSSSSQQRATRKNPTIAETKGILLPVTIPVWASAFMGSRQGPATIAQRFIAGLREAPAYLVP